MVCYKDKHIRYGVRINQTSFLEFYLVKKLGIEINLNNYFTTFIINKNIKIFAKSE